MPVSYTSSQQALSAAEQSAWTAYSEIRGALIQDHATIGRDLRVLSLRTDYALRSAKALVEQLEAARGLISQHTNTKAA